jgi:enoyl-CoA hydratase
MTTTTEFETVLYERPVPKVARIVLNRPETRNAQSFRLLYELNAAFDLAAQDDDISAIILAANGPHFSSGHDLRDTDARQALRDFDLVGTWCGFGCAGAEGTMGVEKEMFYGLSERWRNIPKPTIAAVQGKAVAGALMLIWPCDLIVASDDATFMDPAVSLGVCGAEFFHEPWEFGIRKAKELLFTADTLSAADAFRLGMVNHVVARDDLPTFTLDLAGRIAEKPLFALKLAKEAVNAAQDSQGRLQAMQTGFAYHQLCHSHNQQVYGSPIDPTYMERTFGGK